MNNGTLLAVKFKDHRVFQILSSVHSVADVEVGQNHPGTGCPITKSKIIHDNNKFMRAVEGVIRWWPILASGNVP